jgi:hypothetical protein
LSRIWPSVSKLAQLDDRLSFRSHFGDPRSNFNSLLAECGRGRREGSVMTAGETRPDSIAEVGRRAATGAQPFDAAVREFLDAWQSIADAAKATAIVEEPCHVGRVQDAYLAALAEHLEHFPIIRPRNLRL